MVDGLVPPERTAPPFRAALQADGINVVVAVPSDVSDWFGRSGPVPVCGLVDDVGIEATLVPAGEGRHRLFLNHEMRAATRLQVGDVARFRLWPDPSPRETVVPVDLRAALDAEGLFGSFASWPPSHQREFVLAIEDAKRPETRRRRIRATVEAARSRR